MKRSFFTASLVVGILTLAPASFLCWYGIQYARNGTLYWTQAADRPCLHPLVGVLDPPPVLTISESTELRLLVNQYGRPDLRPPDWELPADSAACDAFVEMDAPAFDIAKAQRTLYLPPEDRNFSVSWVLSPRKVGRQTIVVTSGLDSLKVSISVMSDLGLTARQSALLAAILTAVGTLATIVTIYLGVRNRNRAS